MKPMKFLLIFHSIFLIVSMSITLAFEKFGGEIFAGIFWFNIIYLLVGCTIWYALFILVKKASNNINRLLVINFILGLVLLNILIYLLNGYIPLLALFNHLLNGQRD